MQLYHIYAFLSCPSSFVLGFVWGRGLLHSLRLLLAMFHQRIYLFFNLGLFQAQEERVARISYSSWTQVWVIFPHFSPFTQFINLNTLYPVYIILLSLSSFLFVSSLLENTGSLWLLWSFMHYDKMHYLLKKKKKGSEVTAVTYRWNKQRNNDMKETPQSIVTNSIQLLKRNMTSPPPPSPKGLLSLIASLFRSLV